MQVGEYGAWGREFPVRYLLVGEDEGGGELVLARSAGVEGLFRDPVPPPREVLTLRGCSPRGRLAEAVGGSGAAAELGDLCVEVGNGERPVQWWTLVDTVVIAHRPDRADPALLDITIGAGVVPDPAFAFGPPRSPTFQVFPGLGDAPGLGRCADVHGLLVTRPTAVTPLQLIGCEPTEPLLGTVRRRGRWPGHTELLALDRDGEVMTRRPVILAVEGSRPSVLGGGLLDVTLADSSDRPPRAARPVWEAWYAGRPRERNLWARLDREGREQWLDLTFRGGDLPARDVSGGVHHLDGRYVTDDAALHCALGEALLGPGGYFGREWNAFADCLGGGFGVAPPFTLVWHDAEAARRALAEEHLLPDDGPSYFEAVVARLERSGVTVVLA
ncbi:barstar family protein [Kitasatospora sp. MBT63]|uniref:barstar family protein n=1 Tax=Kitasatospora sp. MBT63 TaxID=1444768 RepID=UPI000539D1BE|nr:barstar family protein [Kitasatospora sp. MBT63]